MKLLAFLIFLISTTLRCNLGEKQIPDHIERCKYGDTECIKDIITHIFHRRYKGDPDIGLVRLDPLKIKKLDIKHKDANINFQNVAISGLKKLEVVEVKGFGKDPSGRHEFHFTKDILNLTGDYKMNGLFNSMNIVGEGKCNITLANVEMNIAFDGEEFTKDGVESIEPKNLEFQLKQKGGSVNFENLFDGNKEKCDAANQILNTNFDNIFDSLNQSISEALGRISRKIIKRVFSKLRYSDLFIEE